MRLVPESDGFRVEHSTPLETLLPQLSSCVLALAELLPADSAALRCVKLQATLGTKQLLCCGSVVCWWVGHERSLLRFGLWASGGAAKRLDGLETSTFHSAQAWSDWRSSGEAFWRG